MIRAGLVLLALIGAWEAYTALSGIDPLVLPAPHDVAVSLWNDAGLLGRDFLVTAEEVLLGIGVAAVAGLGCAVAIHLSRTLRRSVYPLLVASQTIPIPVIAALLVVWLGFDLGPKLAIIGLVSFFPIVVATLDALERVDPDVLKLMRTLDAPRGRAFRLVEWPAALPGVFSGARIAVTIAVIGAVFAEQAGSERGLGHLIQQGGPDLLAARQYAAVIVLSLFAITLFALLTLGERIALPWAHPTPEGRP